MPEVGWFAVAPMSGATYSPGEDPGQSSHAQRGGDPQHGPDRQRGPDPQRDPDPQRRAELADIGRLARRGLDAAVRAARVSELPTLHSLVAGHLGADAREEVDVATQRWDRFEGVNMARAVEAWLAEPGRTSRSYGVPGSIDIGLAEIASGANPFGMPAPTPVAVGRVNLACGPDEMYPCASAAIHLVTDGATRLVLFSRLADPRRGVEHCLVEIASTDPQLGARVSAQLRELSARHNAYRGHVLSLGQDPFGFGEGLLKFERRPTLTRDELVLADGVLPAIERQVVGVARHRDALLAGGQHLKRGLLLYGPPGSGKTHTVRYLASTLPDTTVLLVSGRALGLIGLACSVARTLQPSLVVVEDVDLIAEDRGMHPGEHPLLFELLNEMDGLDGDADVCFLLTTNRADLLEPALAARPGRVDQAIEIDLPDLSARRRLFELYVAGLRLDAPAERIEAALERSEGVTASFLKELARRSALFALERVGAGTLAESAASSGAADSPDAARAADAADSPDAAAAADGSGPAAATGPSAPTVSADDLDAALDDLLDTRNALTRSLLGSARPGSPEPTGTPDGEGPGWES